MLTVLRINRKFMEHMRAHYSKEAKQQFKMTTVPEESGAQPAVVPPNPAATPQTATDTPPRTPHRARGHTATRAVEEV